MPAHTNIIRTITLNTVIPEDVYARAAMFLFSEVEHRIPKGAWSAFLSERIREYFAAERLDLAPYTGGTPGAHIISASPEAIKQLKELLECSPP